ncbi:hypothetical protein K438DRAFT_1986355 [Mycena galopus ATCC 62051]|nr:hypothetical protein K438DRAFT_1986355 [Mycena galopus ATCC 62051]
MADMDSETANPPPANPPPAALDLNAGRPTHMKKLPARYRDILLEPVPVVEYADPPAAPPGNYLPRVNLIVRDTFKTGPNIFGLWREYLHRPTYDPDSLLSLEDLSKQFPRPPPIPPPAKTPAIPPTANRTTTLLKNWVNNGNTTKSEGQVNGLVRDVILDPDFDAKELTNFDAGRANKKVDTDAQASSPLLGNFKETSVEIEVPSSSVSVPPRFFAVPGLYYRSLLFQKVKITAKQIRVLSEIYNSDAFITEHDRIQRKGKLPPDDLERKREKVVAALMWWSESTHLANFGTAKLWPIYLLFGNISMYIRGKPSAGADHHVAYISSLPGSIQDKIASFHAKWGTQKSEILTHCRRELMHAVWTLLLDDEFMHAYEYGIVIQCDDGIERRVYPRFFTYSADYPEKYRFYWLRFEMVETVLVPDALPANPHSTQWDFNVLSARCFIYKSAYGVGSKAVEDVLKETSSVPTLNAFKERLGDDFDLHRMLVVDFMHEFELGVWKNLFTHLIRLLYALPNGKDLVTELDRRYRQMLRFAGKIRRFATNASEMKKLGARDFEDLLQCAIAAFDGLLPLEHNVRFLKLLYRLAEWHACAKLQMHTDPTREHFTKLTPEIGRLIRDFKKTTCSAYTTFELLRETAARAQQEQRAAAATAAKGTGSEPTPTKILNLNTYKWYGMGDYPPTILLFGPTDSYSTQLAGEAHVQSVMRLARARAAASKRKRHAHHFAFGEDEPLGATPPEIHHHTSKARRRPLDMFSHFNVQNTDADPAMVEFVPKLKDHLLGRLLKRNFDGDTHEEFTPSDRTSVRIVGNKIYATGTLRVNYMTYDVQRDQDTLNPRTSLFVMRLDNAGTVTQMAVALAKSGGTSTAGGGATRRWVSTGWRRLLLAGTVTRKAAASDYGGNYTNGGDSWLGNAGTYIESGSSTVTGAVTPKVAASSNGGSYTGQ